MVYVEPEVVNPPKEQSVPQFNKKEIIEVIKKAVEDGLIPSGAGIYQHKFILKDNNSDDAEFVILSYRADPYGEDLDFKTFFENVTDDLTICSVKVRRNDYAGPYFKEAGSWDFNGEDLFQVIILVTPDGEVQWEYWQFIAFYGNTTVTDVVTKL